MKIDHLCTKVAVCDAAEVINKLEAAFGGRFLSSVSRSIGEISNT